MPPNSQPIQAQRSASTSEGGVCLRRHKPLPTHDYNIQWKDFITMMATVKGGVAYREQMIPVFAEELKNSEKGDIYEIFVKTHQRLHKLIPDQIPEFRSTLTQKLSLRNFFQL